MAQGGFGDGPIKLNGGGEHRTKDIVDSYYGNQDISFIFSAYNLIRTVMAQAARRHDREPRALSFKGALQILAAFAPHLQRARRDAWLDLVERILAAVAQHRVADRPDRYEPRARKRRYDNFMHLRRPRAEAKALLLKGVCEEFK